MNFCLAVLNTQTAMGLLFRLSVCVLTCTGQTFGDENGVPCINASAGSDVILNCSLPDPNHQYFDWKKIDTTPVQEVFFYSNGTHYNNGKTGQNENFTKRVDFFKDQLKSGNASIRIKNTKMTDSGIYSCEFPKFHSQQKSYIKLVVDCTNLKDRTNDPEVEDSTKPTIRIMRKENGGKRVGCQVRGPYPQSTMELQDSKNISVPAEKYNETQNGNYFDITLEAVVTKEDYYHCVVKQEQSCYQISSVETLVDLLSDSSKGFIHGGGVGVVIVIAIAALL